LVNELPGQKHSLLNFLIYLGNDAGKAIDLF
jgi:hypothetical protein